MSAETVALDIAALSKWIDEAPANAARDREAAMWGRVAKVSEEAGEVISAMVAATGQNPRKTEGYDDFVPVLSELLDTALTALCAVEHLTDNEGLAMDMFYEHVQLVRIRATDAPPVVEGP